MECRNSVVFLFSLFPVLYYCSIYQAFDGQTELLLVYNFVILSYTRNLQKCNVHKKCVLRLVSHSLQTDICVICSDMNVFS